MKEGGAPPAEAASPRLHFTGETRSRRTAMPRPPAYKSTSPTTLSSVARRSTSRPARGRRQAMVRQATLTPEGTAVGRQPFNGGNGTAWLRRVNGREYGRCLTEQLPTMSPPPSPTSVPCRRTMSVQMSRPSRIVNKTEGTVDIYYPRTIL